VQPVNISPRLGPERKVMKRSRFASIDCLSGKGCSRRGNGKTQSGMFIRHDVLFVSLDGGSAPIPQAISLTVISMWSMAGSMAHAEVGCE
jgi:hypothetical protein